jgi:hypothetical protein
MGTTDYGETTYTFNDKSCRTRYFVHALGTFERPGSIRVIATQEAWNKHGTAVSDLLVADGLSRPDRIAVPTGGTAPELWEMFGGIVDAIREDDQPVLLDITNGLRMQPFFAAACIQYVQAVIPKPPPVRVVYAEYRKDEGTSPVWELTPFLDVLSWSRSLMMFLQTGQTDAVVEPTERLARDLNKQWAASGKQGPQPQLRKLSGAIKRFGDDLTTIRTGSLLLGEQGSARQLAAAIDQTRAEVENHLPALALVLDQVSEMVAPVRGDARLSTAAGQRVLLALARLYQKMRRYSEAISILREGWITLHAREGADVPGESYEALLRDCAEAMWKYRVGDVWKEVLDLRNDIQHAGFRKSPRDKNTFEQQLTKLLTAWEDAINAAQETR